MENMQTICDALLTTLQLTRRYEDIQSITYDAATETVTVTYIDTSMLSVTVVSQ